MFHQGRLPVRATKLASGAIIVHEDPAAPVGQEAIQAAKGRRPVALGGTIRWHIGSRRWATEPIESIILRPVAEHRENCRCGRCVRLRDLLRENIGDLGLTPRRV